MFIVKVLALHNASTVFNFDLNISIVIGNNCYAFKNI